MNRLFKTLLLALLIPVCTLLTMHLRIQGYRLGQGLRPLLINFVRSERILIKDVTSISKQEVPLTAQHEPQGGLKVMSNLNSKLTSLLQPQQTFQLPSWL